MSTPDAVPAATFRFAVNVTPKDGILDPQGRAVEQSLPHLGVTGVGHVRVGRRVELTVVARGTEPLFYQWYFNGTTRLAEATNATLVLEQVSPSEAGSYTVTVTDAHNCTTTCTYTVTQPSAALTATCSGTDVDCFGNTTGSASATVSGGSISEKPMAP